MKRAKAIYLFADSPRSGMRLVALGFMSMLKREVAKVAFFKPIISTKVEEEEDILFFKAHFQLDQEIESAYGLTIERARDLFAEDRYDLLYEEIMVRYKALEEQYDFILCAGVENSATIKSLIDFNIDLHIAANLTIPVVAICNASGVHALSALRQRLQLLLHTLKKHTIQILAVIVNRLDPKLLAEAKQIDFVLPLFILPEERELTLPVMGDILDQTGGVRLWGDETLFDRVVRQVKVGAMGQLEHYLHYLEEGDMIITPGDRMDIVVATFNANLSKVCPSIAGLILTGGQKPAAAVMQMLEGIDMPALPIIGIDTDTHTAVMKVDRVEVEITRRSKRKIALASGLFTEHVDLDLIKQRLFLPVPETMTPVRFTYLLYEKARCMQSHILLPESEDERVLRAAEIVLRRKLCRITLLGNRERVAQRAGQLGLDLSEAQVIDPARFPEREKMAERLYRLRREKGVVLPMAREMLDQINYFATMMLYMGYVDGVVSGATHTTRDTIKPAFEIIKMEEGVGLISSVFFMLLKERVLVYGDCAVNPDPTASELAQIAISSAHTAQQFGIEPRVAMLSYSSGDSGIGADVEKVREATRIAQERAPRLLIEGPMQYDAAIDPDVAKKKMPHSKVAGRATVFIFPDLTTGNNTYKAVQRSAGAIAIGPILQGIRKPVNDLSRGCMIEDIVYTVAITAVQAGMKKR